MNVLLLLPGDPAEMPEFTRGLAEVGAPRRNGRQTPVSDGCLLHHRPHLPTTLAIADGSGTRVPLHAC
jgi:hypothetical protein